MTQNEILFAAIRRLLRPLVRILLRNGIPYAAFLDILKPIYIDMAAKEITRDGNPVTNTRIATITGISRKEVQRVKGMDELDDQWAFERYNRAARVVSGWVRDQRFLDHQGQPAILHYNKTSPSFVELVAAFSGDIPAKTILQELLQAEVVRELQKGRIQLLKRAYIPTSIASEKLGILGSDVAGLISSIEHNIYDQDAPPFLQRKVFYDNLPAEYIPQLRDFVRKHAVPLLEMIDCEMARHDRDVNPDAEGSGRKAAGIGIFYFEENCDDDEKN